MFCADMPTTQQLAEIEGEITKRQTSYLVLKDSKTGAEYRIDFDHKKEFLLEQPFFKGISIQEDHPLLEQHEQQEVSIYISSASSNPEQVLTEIETALHDHFKGWRSLKNYGNTEYSLVKLLRQGNGMLYRGPKGAGELLTGILEKHRIVCSTQQGYCSSEKYKVLLLGASYVVAKEFLFQKSET